MCGSHYNSTTPTTRRDPVRMKSFWIRIGPRYLYILQLIIVLANMTLFICAAAAQKEISYVPQLDLTDLEPRRVAFCPDDETLILVLNLNGRVDLFDVSNPRQPVKVAEIGSDVRAATFTPKGTSRERFALFQVMRMGVSGSGQSAESLHRTHFRPMTDR